MKTMINLIRQLACRSLESAAAAISVSALCVVLGTAPHASAVTNLTVAGNGEGILYPTATNTYAVTNNGQVWCMLWCRAVGGGVPWNGIVVVSHPLIRPAATWTRACPCTLGPRAALVPRLPWAIT